MKTKFATEKPYAQPKLLIQTFDGEDIITTSNPNNYQDDIFGPEEENPVGDF